MYPTTEPQENEARILGFDPKNDQSLNSESDGNEIDEVDYPILLNHELIFLIVSGILSLTVLIILLFVLPMRESWLLGIVVSVVFGLLGTIMSDNLVMQIKAIFRENLKDRINKNHLIKTLKLNRLKETGFDFIVSVSYVTVLIIILTIFYIRHPVTINFQGIIELMTRFWMLFGIHFDTDIGWMLFLPIAYFIMASLAFGFYLLSHRYFPKSVHTIIFFPLIYLMKIISTFHEVFKSVIKIAFYIIATWREFALSSFYLLITGIISLGKKHFISNIEVDYMLYVKSGFLLMGALGYLFCIIRSYSR